MNWKQRVRGLALLALLFVALPGAWGQWLKQSTACVIKFGPFLDETNGKDVEPSLDIDQYDVRLSKNGGNFGDKHDDTSLAYDEIGYYDLELDTTDTNTLGRLLIAVHESGALPVWKEYLVVDADTYDSVCGSDYLQVDVIQVSSATPVTASDLADAVWNEESTGHTTAGYAGAAIWTSIPAILADTGTDGVKIGSAAITTASFAAGAIDAAAIAANAIGASELATDAVTEIYAHAVEDAITMDQAMRLVIAWIAGKATGGGTTSITYRDQGDTLNRITLTVDANGNRTATAIVVTD